MNIKRNILNQLTDWKDNSRRKPLILRGARQVGKTTVINEFSTSYNHFISLNLEKRADSSFFKDYDNIQSIVEAIFISNNKSLDDIESTLLFIDEIQESPEAIHLLRYFYEDYPLLHVISAGSLLEFILKDVSSFPVGRVEFLYMYPLNFKEYLSGINHKLALDNLRNVPITNVAHKILLDLFNQYAIIGGMPEVVKTYIEDGNITNLPKIYESIWSTYKSDIEKYSTNKTAKNVTRHIMQTAPVELDKRIKFENFGNSNYRSREVGEAFRNLDDSKVIRLIYPTTNLQPPILADTKKRPRLQFLDTGLINHELGIQASLLALDDLSSAYKGALIPHLITQELLSLNTYRENKPNFWVRENKDASSEIDLVYTFEDKLIPIEIKSGKTGTLKSLHEYMDRAPHTYAVRMYGGAFSVEASKTPKGKSYKLMNLPYYLTTMLPEYISILCSKH